MPLPPNPIRKFSFATLLSRRFRHGLLPAVLATTLLLTVLPPQAVALTAPQDPATEAIIVLEADGVAPFDLTTFDPDTVTNSGTDGDIQNGIVRNLDAVTYNVEVSLNDGDDTNVAATVTLNDKASWAAVPEACKTIALGFTVAPDSTIADTTGDGLNDTLVCNLGDHNEGTKVLFKPVAIASGNNGETMSASVISSSDNNVNTSGQPGTQGDGPIDTVITAGFGINITKRPCGYVEQAAIPNETNCQPQYSPADTIAPGSPETQFLQWHITLNYDAGSEFVADNGAGTQDFTITDTWIGSHSNDPTIDSDNANGDFDDQVRLKGAVTGDAADSCELLNPLPGATVTCTQPGPGEPISIQLNDIAVNQQPLATVLLNMGLGHPDIFDPNGDTIESYDINNTATLTGWGGAGTMVTSGSGTVHPGPETATEDFPVNNQPPGPLAFYKSFDGLGVTKSGQRAAAPGDTVAASIVILDGRTFDTNPGICDTIDTSVFEFGGSIGAGQLDGVANGDPTPYGSANGSFNATHHSFNPQLVLSQSVDWAGTGISLDARQHGVAIEFSDVDYATTGDDHWSATCEDDLTGDNMSDWVSDYNTLPGGEASVVRVRLVWDRDYSSMEVLRPNLDRSGAIFSFDLVLLPSAPVGDRLPNAASTKRPQWPTVWTGPENWLSPTQFVTGWNVYERVEQDSNEGLFSFNTVNADRVLVVPASMSIVKANDPVDRGPVTSKDAASFTIDPNVSGSGPAGQTMTFTDTLPPELTYVTDDCAAVYGAVGLTCSAAVSGQTVTWTVTGYTIGEDLPSFGLDTIVAAGTASGTYINEVEISSSWSNLSDDSHCDTAVNTAGLLTADSMQQCREIFTDPHDDTASVLVLADSGVEVIKADETTIVEPRSPYLATLSYINLGGGDVGVGHLIDILPYNGDGTLASVYSPQRFNSENTTNPNTATQTADPDEAADFVSITASAAGETFEYSTDAPTGIDHRPCHPGNWAAGDDELTNATLALVCSRGLIDPATDVPTAGTPGTGATTWGPLPANPADVTAVRVLTPDFPGGDPQRDVLLTLNTAYAQEGDLFCNNFGANANVITLDIISNDVCAEVVAGSIGDYVWNDSNSDGVQDSTEDPLPGVGIRLLVEDPANSGTYIPFQIPDQDNPGTFIDYVTTTGDDGEYLFENLPSGNYRVMVDPATLAPDVVQTFDNEGPLDNMSDVSLFGPNNPETPSSVYTDVDDDRDQDFGYDVPVVDLALAKTTNATSAYPGQDVLFTIEVLNQGEVEMANVLVADYVPTGFTISPDDPNSWTTDGTTPTVGGESGTLLATIAGPIAAGNSGTINILLTVALDASAGDLVNVAEIAAMEDGAGNDRTLDDVDSTADTDIGNDVGGNVGTDEDNHVDDDGTDSDGDGIIDQDDSDPAVLTVVQLAQAAIDIEKFTNGVDSDQAPGETIVAGTAVTWTYVVTNTGSTALANATVTDDKGVAVDCGDGSNVIALLVPGQTVTCEGSGLAQTGAYTNKSTVLGDAVMPEFSACGCDPNDPATWPNDSASYEPAIGADGQPLGPVTDEDPSNYTGVVVKLAFTGLESMRLLLVASFVTLVGAAALLVGTRRRRALVDVSQN